MYRSHPLWVKTLVSVTHTSWCPVLRKSSCCLHFPPNHTGNTHLLGDFQQHVGMFEEHPPPRISASFPPQNFHKIPPIAIRSPME